MTPPERHAAVLEALNQQIGSLAARHDLAEILMLVSSEPFEQHRARLEGCRRIIQRHAPELVKFENFWVCQSSDGTHEWPCADWLDASAGVEER